MKPWVHRGRRASKALVIAAVSVLALELMLRAIHLNRCPILPCRLEGGVTMLPASVDLTVAFDFGPPRRYVTDSGGARVASPEARAANDTGAVLVVGDSQALGYGLAFESTFAAALARALTGDAANARLLAAPGLEPQTSLMLLRRDRAAHPSPPRLAVVVLNMANDLDELYLAGATPADDDSTQLEQWLSLHSFLYMDLASVAAFGRLGWGMAVSPVLASMDSAERVKLAGEAVDLLHQHAASLDGAGRVVFVILPCNYQVDPAMFRNYRPSFASRASFEHWYARVDDLAAKMNAVQSYIASSLRRRGHTVVCMSDLVPRAEAGDWYDPVSHHITARAHRAIAADILRRLDAGPGVAHAR